MADYSFDGERLRRKSTGETLAQMDRDTVRLYNGAVYGRIERTNLRDPRGKKIAEFDGKSLKDDRGKRLAGIEEIQETIEGEADISMAAMWYFFVKKR